MTDKHYLVLKTTRSTKGFCGLIFPCHKILCRRDTHKQGEIKHY